MASSTSDPSSRTERQDSVVPSSGSSEQWLDIEYDLGAIEDDNVRISRILNEACHVFHRHAEGLWCSADKDAYASMLADERRPGLVGRLLNTDDRGVKMLAHRALEMVALRKGHVGGGAPT
jgi:hypothetical protein